MAIFKGGQGKMELEVEGAGRGGRGGGRGEKKGGREKE